MKWESHKDEQQVVNRTEDCTDSRTRVGRPPRDLTPKTPLAKRLQLILGDRHFAEIGEKMGVRKDAAIRYLRGELPPSAKVIENVIRRTGCDPRWLILGEGVAYPREYVTHPRPEAPVTVPPQHRPQPALHIPSDAAYVTTAADHPPLVNATRHALFIADKSLRPRDGELVAHIGNAPDKATCYRIFVTDDGYCLVAMPGPQPPRQIKHDDLKDYRVVLGLWFL